MSRPKRRVTITVDPDLLEAGHSAVASGQVDSLSGWISTALTEKIDRDHKHALLRAAIASYEAEFGEITPQEIAAQRRADRADAAVVRSPSRRAPASRRAKTA
jgi:hypothetical protein